MDVNELKRSKKNIKPTIILMTKWPAINRCKTRLSKEIGAFQAAKIQSKLTNHTILVAKQIQDEGLAELKIAINGISLKAAKKWARINKIKNIRLF